MQYICPFDVEAAGQAQDLPEGTLEEDFERVVAAHSADSEHEM